MNYTDILSMYTQFASVTYMKNEIFTKILKHNNTYTCITIHKLEGHSMSNIKI